MSYVKGSGGYKFRYQEDTTIPDKYLRCQIDAMSYVGITPLIATNWDFEYKGIKSIKVPMYAKWSAFGNKIPILNHIVRRLGITDDICYQDIDAWTLVKHDFPCTKDVGFVLHSLPGNSKKQGGVQYWGKNSYDIIEDLAISITSKQVKKEESFFNKFFRNNKYEDRIEILNYRFNFFRQSEMGRKYPLTELPIINLHFKPEYDTCWDRFIGKAKPHIKVIPDWLEELFYKHELRKIDDLS